MPCRRTGRVGTGALPAAGPAGPGPARAHVRARGARPRRCGGGRGDRIAAVGPLRGSSARDIPDAEVVGDGTGILTPGFVSCHGHFSEGLVSGIGETHTLWEWFVHVVGPIEPYLTREMALRRHPAQGRGAGPVGGDHDRGHVLHRARARSRSTPGVVEALDRLGLRGDVSYGAADDPNPRPLERCWPSTRRSPRPPPRRGAAASGSGLATVPAASDELIAATAELVAEHGAAARAPARGPRGGHRSPGSPRGVGSIEFAARAGLLDAQVVAAHCVWLDDTDVALLRRHDVAVAHNPVSNMILASGVCPVPRLLREGVTVGLGVDGAGQQRQPGHAGDDEGGGAAAEGAPPAGHAR